MYYNIQYGFFLRKLVNVVNTDYIGMDI